MKGSEGCKGGCCVHEYRKKYWMDLSKVTTQNSININMLFQTHYNE